MNSSPRIALAANRQLGVQALEMLMEAHMEPVALLLASGKSADASAMDMRRILPSTPTIFGKHFRSEQGLEELAQLDVDYVLSVHFPYIIPQAVLDLPRIGSLNLHPALLPYNRGWHTPSWAILEQTPYGATLHWVDAGMDTGDLALQRPVPVLPNDTANSLYGRVLDAELELLREAIPLLKSGQLPRVPQQGPGTEHVKADLAAMRELHLDEQLPVGEVLRRLRALTTSREDEAAWFEQNGERYLLQLSVTKQEPDAMPVRRAA